MKPRIARERLPGLATVCSVANGHRRPGTFGPGNTAAKGRGRELKEWRGALREAFTPEMLAKVTAAMYREAVGGNVHAARLLFEHALGRPSQRFDVNVLDGDGDPSCDESTDYFL